MNQFQLRRKNIAFVVVAGIILITLFVFYAFFAFTRNLNEMELEQRQAQLKELSLQEAFTVDALIKSFKDSSNALAEALSTPEAFSEHADINQLLFMISSNLSADRMMIAQTDGTLPETEVQIPKLASMAFFKRALIGQTAISSVMNDKESGQNYFMIASPIMYQAKVQKILLASYNVSTISELLDVTSFEGEGYSHVFQISDGKFVSYSTRANNDGTDPASFYRMADVTYEEGYSFLEIYGAVHQKLSGLVAYYADSGEKFYGYYSPSKVDNWYIFTIVPARLLDRYSNISSDLALKLIIRICAAFFVLLLITLLLYYRFQRDLIGSNEQMRISEEGFRIAVDHMHCFVFAVNLISGNFEIMKQPDNHAVLSSTEVFDFNEIVDLITATEYREAVKNMMREIQVGGKGGDCLIRVRYIGRDNYEWAKLTLSSIFNDNCVPIKVIGTLEDVNDQVEKERSLQQQAETDPLTGIANRTAMRKWIDAFDREVSQNKALNGAYILIDIDNFKHFNDTYGHSFGDLVLKKVARLLTEKFSVFPDTLTGRIGGDEFAVMIKDAAERQKIISAAEEYCRVIHENCTDLPEKCVLTTSMGIAFSEDCDQKFALLFDRADKAMYQAKKSGKNQVRVYDKSMPERPEEETRPA